MKAGHRGQRMFNDPGGHYGHYVFGNRTQHSWLLDPGD